MSYIDGRSTVAAADGEESLLSTTPPSPRPKLAPLLVVDTLSLYIYTYCKEEKVRATLKE
jgi:hypothetical protein